MRTSVKFKDSWGWTDAFTSVFEARDSPFDSGFAVPQTISCPKIWADFLCDIHVTHEEEIPDGPPRMVKRPTGSGGEPSSPNCGASAGGKARQLLLTNRWLKGTRIGPRTRTRFARQGCRSPHPTSVHRAFAGTSRLNAAFLITAVKESGDQAFNRRSSASRPSGLVITTRVLPALSRWDSSGLKIQAPPSCAASTT